MENVTIVIPIYNESDGVSLFYTELNNITKSLTDYNFTFLFINDGSIDNTFEKLQELFLNDSKIRIVNFSRNHGKELALAAGFDFTENDQDIIILMDSDLQHPPKMISLFLEKIKEGYDDVYAVRKNRDDETFLKKKFSKLYYILLQRFSTIPVYPDAGDFRALNKNAFNALKSIRDKERYTKGYYSLIGYKKYAIEFEVPDRVFGVSKWNYFKLTQLAINGLTSFSNAPLRIATFLGISVSFFSFLYLIFIVFKTIFIGEEITGFPTLISAILFLGGLQMFFIGVIGEYVGKIFNEVKDRPLYFVKDFIKK